MRRLVLSLGFLAAFAPRVAWSQAHTTASRLADIQVGVDYTPYARSDYTINSIRGYGFYGTIDWTNHWGLAADYHQLNDPQPTKVYERTYEIGGRYVRHYGLAHPYAKAMYGRGVFNFPADCRDKTTNFPVACNSSNVNPATDVSVGNLAYNMMVGGAGVDFHVTKRINVRADYEYQKWFSGEGLSGGLAPQLFTIGVAWHFPPGIPRRGN